MSGSKTPRRIAMWSGPRNISTALLRSWGNRPDTLVCDEPLYAHYLEQTGLDHPGADEVLEHHETDWRSVVRWLTGPVPEGRSVFYQKHMAHHLLPDVGREWLADLTHCFLIREPREMLTSLIRKNPQPTLADTGLPQQLELFERECERSGRTQPVVDARDVLEDPRRMLARLCAAVDVPFLEEMLHWPAGPRETDGIWAKHWYAAVEVSTGFNPYAPKPEPLPERLAELHARCDDYYATLHRHRLTVSE